MLSVVAEHDDSVLLEPLELASRSYEVTATNHLGGARAAPRAFSEQSALTRWLRVNNDYLPVPDRAGVIATLASVDQEQLERWRVAGCIPFVHERQLVGWVAVSGADPAMAEARVRPVMSKTADLARRLYAAQVKWHDERQLEDFARSNRLSVAGQVAASIAHEIRNPLAAIRSTVQMLRDDEVPSGVRPQLMSTVLTEVDRVNRTLVEMLALGRRRPTLFETCDLDAVVNQAVAFCHGYAERSQIVVDRTGQTATIQGDGFELRQVLVNLLLNACQGSRAGSTVRIETGLDQAGQVGTEAMVRVVDHGVGISPENLARVFDPFFTTKTDGGGLGLAICRDTIRRHGGRMELDSQVGVGTTVTIFLPRS
jgi:signal transduction histidine kinase